MRALLLLSALALCGSAAQAQGQQNVAASSASYFMSAQTFGSGDEADTLFYKTRSALGDGLVVEPDSASATYRVRGGFFGAFTAPMLGQPWLTSAVPLFVRPKGNDPVSLRGTELWLGTPPVVTVGGVPAAVGARTVSQLQITVPNQPAPGYQPVVFTNSSGTTRLEQGLGVLPLVELREPLNGFDANLLRFRTLPGDFVILALATSLFPTGISIADWNFKLLLDPNTIVLTDSYFVGSPDGSLALPIPPFFQSGMAHIQGLVLSVDPALSPASFTNVLSL
jgi:hypothetical protein